VTSFPEQFLWGVSSSSFQIEGGTNEGGRSPSVWDTFCATPGKVFEGHTGDPACGSYADPVRDADLVAGLGCGAYRFSVAWARVLPGGDGDVNEAGLDYYERLCDLLLERGVQPWVTLYHWDLPQALEDRGGWRSPEMPGWFERYTEVVADRLGGKAAGWYTLNEPQIFLGMGLSTGEHAPGLKLPRKDVLQAIHHALLAHGRAVKVLRTASPSTPIGWVPTGLTTAPATESEADIEAARTHTFALHDQPDWWFNHAWFSDPALLGHYPEQGLALVGDDAPDIKPGDLETIAQPVDFLAFNLYTGSLVRAGADGRPEQLPHPPGHPITSFRWPLQPETLRWAARFLHERYGLPLYVGENGLASMDWVHADGKVHDAGRIDYLTRYLSELRQAIADGADVRGYFQWSILDNFEWAEGYRMRFGLTYVDFVTGERIPKDSYEWYREVVATNGASLPDAIEPLR